MRKSPILEDIGPGTMPCRDVGEDLDGGGKARSGCHGFRLSVICSKPKNGRTINCIAFSDTRADWPPEHSLVLRRGGPCARPSGGMRGQFGLIRRSIWVEEAGGHKARPYEFDGLVPPLSARAILGM